MKAELVKDRLFLKKIADNYVLHRIKDGILTIEGDSHHVIHGIEPFYKLSLKNCEAIERGYDLDELAKREYLDGYDTTELCRTTFKDGFQKALEILGDKKFSEEDINNAMNWIMTQYFEFYEQPTAGRREHYIQSLQQTEWEVTFNPDEKDSEGFLILKRV